jgi:hypothetical protein
MSGTRLILPSGFHQGANRIAGLFLTLLVYLRSYWKIHTVISLEPTCCVNQFYVNVTFFFSFFLCSFQCELNRKKSNTGGDQKSRPILAQHAPCWLGPSPSLHRMELYLDHLTYELSPGQFFNYTRLQCCMHC